MGMPEFLVPVIDWIVATNVPQQIQEVDAKGLFTNFYFMVPFVLLVGHVMYKQEVNNLVIIALGVGLWIFSGSHFMANLFVDDEMQIGKLLPVLAVWIGAIGVFIYFLFIRSD